MSLPCRLFRPPILTNGASRPPTSEEMDSFFSQRYANRPLSMFPGEGTLDELRRRDTLRPPDPSNTQPLPSTFRRRQQVTGQPLTGTAKAVVFLKGQHFAVMHQHKPTGYKTKGLTPIPATGISSHTQQFSAPMIPGNYTAILVQHLL